MKYLISQYNKGYERGAEDSKFFMAKNNVFTVDSQEYIGYEDGYVGIPQEQWTREEIIVSV